MFRNEEIALRQKMEDLRAELAAERAKNAAELAQERAKNVSLQASLEAAKRQPAAPTQTLRLPANTRLVQDPDQTLKLRLATPLETNEQRAVQWFLVLFPIVVAVGFGIFAALLR